MLVGVTGSVAAIKVPALVNALLPFAEACAATTTHFGTLQWGVVWGAETAMACRSVLRNVDRGQGWEKKGARNKVGKDEEEIANGVAKDIDGGKCDTKLLTTDQRMLTKQEIRDSLNLEPWNLVEVDLSRQVCVMATPAALRFFSADQLPPSACPIHGT